MFFYLYLCRLVSRFRFQGNCAETFSCTCKQEEVAQTLKWNQWCLFLWSNTCKFQYFNLSLFLFWNVNKHFYIFRHQPYQEGRGKLPNRTRGSNFESSSSAKLLEKKCYLNEIQNSTFMMKMVFKWYTLKI